MAAAVIALRAAGHDIVYGAERASDPGDTALLAEAVTHRRVFITKDHDLGTLVFRDGAAHAGVLLIDDLGSAEEETALLQTTLAQTQDLLVAGAFVRARRNGWRAEGS